MKVGFNLLADIGNAVRHLGQVDGWSPDPNRSLKGKKLKKDKKTMGQETQGWDPYLHYLRRRTDIKPIQARIYTDKEIEVANTMLLLCRRTVGFSPPPERNKWSKKTTHPCKFCGACGVGDARRRCRAISLAWAAGHIGRSCPDNTKGKKPKKGPTYPFLPHSPSKIYIPIMYIPIMLTAEDSHIRIPTRSHGQRPHIRYRTPYVSSISPLCSPQNWHQASPARIYAEKEIELANIMLLFRQRAVVFYPPPEIQHVVKKATHHCKFCGAEGNNVATCAAAPCNRCGLRGHIGRKTPRPRWPRRRWRR